jgi:biotin carboxyl carrier protein
MAVDLAEVTQGPLRVTVDEDGRARVKDRFVISAPLVGSLARIELDPGDAVTEGQMLARLVPLLPPLMDERTRTGAEARVAATDAGRKQVRAQLERATAAYKHAKSQADRMRALAESNSISPAALDDALLQERATQAELSSLEFAARVSDHELQMAAAALRRVSGTTADSRGERLDVVSPVSGRVLRVVRQSEGVVQPGEPLLELGRSGGPRARGRRAQARALTKVYHMGEVDVHALRGRGPRAARGGDGRPARALRLGKSTLLNILGGLDVPSSGHVLYHGNDLTEAAEAELTAYRRRTWASCSSSTT